MRVIFLFLVSLTTAPVLSAGEKARSLPAAATEKISFSKDVKVLLGHNCFECHANGKKKGALDMSSRESLLKGGESGAAIVPGKSAESALIKRLVSSDPEEVMPQKKPALKDSEIAILRAWIDQGMLWDDMAIDRAKKIDVAPRRPKVAGSGNAVDLLLKEVLAKSSVSADKVVDDRMYARRVYLDATGVQPTPAELAEFIADTQPEKRERLVQKVLANAEGYTAHWISFWSDLLRNGTTLAGIDGHANVNVTPWLERSLKENKPYDQFVRELVAPAKETEAFIQGVTMRGVIPASQTPEMQAAQNVAQVFLGIQLKCASCHDSFVSRWTLEDAYGMASVFSDKTVELVRCEIPTGKTAVGKFIYPELGTFDAKAPRPQRLQQLADLITRKENGQFARTIANRIFGRLFGRAIVEPVDEMENAPWHPELLDYLGSYLSDNAYDLKKLMALLMTSKAYQLQPGNTKNDKSYIFRGPLVRRLTAEQYLDNVYALLSIPRRAWKEKATPLTESLGRPDRNNVATTRESESTTLQALELINGPDLQKLIYVDGLQQINALLIETKKSKPEFLARLYLQALGRKPAASEIHALESIWLGQITPETAADMVWAVIMLPEFQLIR